MYVCGALCVCGAVCAWHRTQSHRPSVPWCLGKTSSPLALHHTCSRLEVLFSFHRRLDTAISLFSLIDPHPPAPCRAPSLPQNSSLQWRTRLQSQRAHTTRLRTAVVVFSASSVSRSLPIWPTLPISILRGFDGPEPPACWLAGVRDWDDPTPSHAENST